MIDVITHVLKHSKAASATDQCVLLVLANHAHEDGTHCFPSIATIARQAKASEATTKRAIARLVSAGAISRTRRGSTSNLYTLNLDASETIETTATTMPETARPAVASGLNLSPPIAQSEPPDSSICAESERKLSPEPLPNRHSNRQGSRKRARATSAGTGLRPHTLPEPALSGTVEPDDLRLVNVYARLWTHMHQADPHIDYSRDRGIMQALLRQHPAHVIEAALRVYFSATSDTWLLRNKYPLTTFRAQFNRYQATAGRGERLSRLSPAGASTAVALDGWLASQAAMGDA